MKFRKYFKPLVQDILYYILCVLSVLSALAFARVTLSASSDNLVYKSLLRFHVIAESDSPKDQAIKLQVRDETLKILAENMSSAENAHEAAACIENNLASLEQQINTFLKTLNAGYNAKAELVCEPFPERSYGSLTLPAGNYKALRITLGNAGGRNWWCILYPRLCFVDGTYTLAVSDKLFFKKFMLTESPDNIILNTIEHSQVSVKYRFRILEWFKSKTNGR